MDGARGFQRGGASPELFPAAAEERGVGGGEEDLELGLSLGAGAKKGRPCGGSRILTANDLRSLASPLPSTSVCSSSSSTSASGGAATKTAPRRVAPGAGGATSPPSHAVVGWPPIRAFRINTLVNQSRDNFSDSDAATAHNKNNNNKIGRRECVGGKDHEKKPGGHPGTSCFIKVNMDGDPIGRKVDLNAHHSYQTLVLSLEAMFHKTTLTLGTAKHGVKASKLLDGSSEFALTYKDKDGDWMLVGDVPFRMFLDTVKRLRIMRTSDASGLGPSRFPITDKSGGPIRFEPA